MNDSRYSQIKMQNSHTSISGPQGRVKRVGIFADVSNVQSICLNSILSYANTLGNVVLSRAYIPITSQVDLPSIVRSGFSPIIVTNKGIRTTDTDSQMIVDIMDQPFTDIFIIATGDRDFVPAVEWLIGKGKYVILIGREASFNRRLTHKCDYFIDIETL